MITSLVHWNLKKLFTGLIKSQVFECFCKGTKKYQFNESLLTSNRIANMNLMGVIVICNSNNIITTNWI